MNKVFQTFIIRGENDMYYKCVYQENQINLKKCGICVTVSTKIPKISIQNNN
jgi:hypothetical protein